MAILTVFISHSAQGDSEATTVRDALHAALEKADYHTFVDSSHLRHGKPWRERVNTYLTRCDSVLVLVPSKDSELKCLAYEVAILCHRRDRKSKLTQRSRTKRWVTRNRFRMFQPQASL